MKSNLLIDAILDRYSHKGIFFKLASYSKEDQLYGDDEKAFKSARHEVNPRVKFVVVVIFDLVCRIECVLECNDTHSPHLCAVGSND